MHKQKVNDMPELEKEFKPVRPYCTKDFEFVVALLAYNKQRYVIQSMVPFLNSRKPQSRDVQFTMNIYGRTDSGDLLDVVDEVAALRSDYLSNALRVDPCTLFTVQRSVRSAIADKIAELRKSSCVES